jgi:hypothetical protein
MAIRPPTWAGRCTSPPPSMQEWVGRRPVRDEIRRGLEELRAKRISANIVHRNRNPPMTARICANQRGSAAAPALLCQPGMKRLTALLLALAFAPSAGCVLYTHPRHRHTAVAPAPRCHPSQYWDGHKCRHKGKGHGARKHDGR